MDLFAFVIAFISSCIVLSSKFVERELYLMDVIYQYLTVKSQNGYVLFSPFFHRHTR